MYDYDHARRHDVTDSGTRDVYNTMQAGDRQRLLKSALRTTKRHDYYRKLVFYISIAQAITGAVFIILTLTTFDRVEATAQIPWEALLFVSAAIGIAMHKDLHMPMTTVYGVLSMFLFLLSVAASIEQIIAVAKCTGAEDAGEGECYDEVAVLKAQPAAADPDADGKCYVSEVDQFCEVECTAVCPSGAELGGQLAIIVVIFFVSLVQMILGIYLYNKYDETKKAFDHLERLERRSKGSAWHQDMIHHSQQRTLDPKHESRFREEYEPGEADWDAADAEDMPGSIRDDLGLYGAHEMPMAHSSVRVNVSSRSKTRRKKAKSPGADDAYLLSLQKEFSGSHEE